MMKKRSPKQLSQELIGLLKKHRLTLSLAESCTGGLVSSLMTSHAGVSEVYLGGVVSYSDQSKMVLLNVRRQTLKKYGAVSLSVAEQMSLGARLKFSSDLALSITGIAGPNGGTKAKPVGTVCFAVHSRTETVLQQMKFSGSRQKIQMESALHGMKMLVDAIQGS
jgi:PncC family amidohydrolase